MIFFSQIEQMKKSQLWFIAVIISILLTEAIVSVMDVLIKGKVTSDYLLTGLVASGFVATFVVGLVGFFLERLSYIQEDNSYLNSVIDKLNQLTMALRNNDESYRSILATTLDGFWILSSEGKLLDVNDRYIEQSGYSREELLNMHIVEVEAKESVEQNAAHIQHVIDVGGDQFESIHRRKDGTFWQVEVSATYRAGVFYVFLRDITARKQAERGLQESQEMLLAITDNSNALIFIKNLKSQFIFVNRYFEEIYDIKNSSFLGKSTDDIFPQNLADKFNRDDQLVIASGLPITIEEAVPHSDGVYTYVTVKFPLRKINGEIYAVCGIATDITDRKRLEQEVKLLSESELNKAKLEAEKANQAKSDFLASMSHELFTPMNAVLGFAQVLATEELTPEQYEFVDSILSGGYKLLDLIKEVLDFSIIESEQLEIIIEQLNLAVVVQSSIKLMQSLAVKKGITMVDNIATNCQSSVLADSFCLKQVLLNLISNAIKYNRVDGCITLSCELITPKIIRINITDTGAGLSEEQIGKLFLPFERLHAKNSAIEGAGLGLCISKTLIEAMDGTIGVSSTIGEGSCFWIEMPLAKTEN